MWHISHRMTFKFIHIIVHIRLLRLNIIPLYISINILCMHSSMDRNEFFFWGARVAQSVKCLTLGFGSGHDLTGLTGSSPASGSVLAAQSLLGILCLPLSLSLLHLLCLSQNKISLKKINPKK